MNSSCWKCNFTEDVVQNETAHWFFNATENDAIIDGSEQSDRKPVVTLFFAMATTIRIALGCSSATLNYFLLYGLSRIENSRLKVKPLIQTTAIANIMLPFASGLKPEVFVAPFWTMSDSLSLCFTMVYRFIYTLAIYVQSLCNMGLACDRLYAVIKPLKYHTTGYHKVLRVCMFIAPVSVALLVYVLFVALSVRFNPLVPPGFSPVCVVLLGAQKMQMNSKFFSNTLLLCNFASFFIYMSLLVVLRYQRGEITNVSESSVKRESAVLSVTYLLTNLSTLLLYTPGPLIGLFVPLGGFEFPRLFSTMYMVNPSLIPIILMVRIPSIRRNLPFKSRIWTRASSAATNNLKISQILHS